MEPPAPSAAAPVVADAGRAVDASVDAAPANATTWRAIVPRRPVHGAAWTKGGVAVIVTQTDIWTIDPATPTKAHATPLSQAAGQNASIAAREDSDVVAVSLADGSVDVLVGSVLQKTLPPMAKGIYGTRVRLSDDGQSLVAEASASRGREFVRIYNLKTWTSKPIPRPPPLSPHGPRPYRVPRADGAFSLVIDSGVQIIEPTGRVRVDWSDRSSSPIRVAWRHQAIEVQQGAPPFFPFYRFSHARGDTAPDAGALEEPAPIPATAACGASPERVDERAGTATYIVQNDWIEGVCFCTKEGCKLTWLKEPPPGPASEPLIHEVVLGFGDGGAFLSKTTADDEASNVVTLHPALAAAHAKTVKIRSGSLHCDPSEAAFVGDRVFVRCYGEAGTELLELSPKNLSVLARRSAPTVDCSSTAFASLGEQLFFGCTYAGEGELLEADWVKDPNKSTNGHLFLWSTAGIFLRADGKIETAGKAADLDAEIRCFDGENLAPFAACKDALVVQP